MLKIKDNVDLKELEKFIGIKINNGECEFEITGICIDTYDSENCKRNVCFILDDNIDVINIENIGQSDWVFSVSNQLQDLIQNNLVEDTTKINLQQELDRKNKRIKELEDGFKASNDELSMVYNELDEKKKTIKEMSKSLKDWDRIFDTFSKRKYAHRYLEERRKENPNLLCPDSDEIYQKYYELKDNWNKLKDYLETNWESTQDIWFVKLIIKMQELEKGSEE